MTYLNDLEREYKILRTLETSEIPLSTLQIARDLGYKTPSQTQKTLDVLQAAGMVMCFETLKKNGTVRKTYLISIAGETELDYYPERLIGERTTKH